MAEPEIVMPQEPGANLSRTKDMIYAKQVKQYDKREGLLTSNKQGCYARCDLGTAKQSNEDTNQDFWQLPRES